MKNDKVAILINEESKWFISEVSRLIQDKIMKDFTEVAKEIGMRQSNLSAIMRGKRNAPKLYVIKLQGFIQNRSISLLGNESDQLQKIKFVEATIDSMIHELVEIKAKCKIVYQNLDQSLKSVK